MVAWLLRSLLKMRLNATRLGSIASSRSFGDQLDDLAGQVPSLDLNFAQNKSLIDDYSGTTLVTHTRASSGTYVDSAGVIQTAATDVPRFDHDPTTGESLGLLLEEARTNLLLQSNQFDTTWTNTLTSGTAAAGIAPDGTNTAWELKDTVDVSPASHIIAQASVPFTSGLTYTFSVFAKAGTVSAIAFVFPSSMVGTATIGVKANLSTGAIIATGSGATSSVTQYPNGWYRITSSMTATATGNGNFQIRMAPLSGIGTNYQGDGNGTIYIWGAQFEAGSFPTSYIPTTTATVTRAADVASITGSNFSSWYRQDEGTVFANATTNARHAGTDTFPRIASLSDGTTNNRMELLYRVLTSYTDAGYRVASSNVLQATFDTNNERNGQSMATAYAANNFAFTVGGTLANTDTAGTVPTVDRLSIGLRSGIDLQMSGTIRRLTYWPVRLSNEVLQRITQ
jgi:hypothetical protein